MYPALLIIALLKQTSENFVCAISTDEQLHAVSSLWVLSTAFHCILNFEKPRIQLCWKNMYLSERRCANMCLLSKRIIIRCPYTFQCCLCYEMTYWFIKSIFKSFWTSGVSWKFETNFKQFKSFQFFKIKFCYLFLWNRRKDRELGAWEKKTVQSIRLMWIRDGKTQQLSVSNSHQDGKWTRWMIRPHGSSVFSVKTANFSGISAFITYLL